MKFSDIPQYPYPNYKADFSIKDVPWMIEKYKKNHSLNMTPDYQRGHVWTEEQQVAFISFLLHGGQCPILLFNHPSWMNFRPGDSMELVDGLQRITAILKFLNNELKVMGHYFNEFEGHMGHLPNITVGIFSFSKRSDLLKVYISMNAGGTPHSNEEIQRVEMLYKNTLKEEEGARSC